MNFFDTLSFMLQFFYQYYFVFFYGQNYELISEIFFILLAFFFILLFLYIIIFLRYYRVYFINYISSTGLIDIWFRKVLNDEMNHITDTKSVRNFILRFGLGFFTFLEFFSMFVILFIVILFIIFRPTIHLPGSWGFKLLFKPLFFFSRSDSLFRNADHSTEFSNPMLFSNPYPEEHPNFFIENFMSNSPSLMFNKIFMVVRKRKSKFDIDLRSFFNKNISPLEHNLRFRNKGFILSGSLFKKIFVKGPFTNRNSWVKNLKDDAINYFKLNGFKSTDGFITDTLFRKKINVNSFPVTFRPDSAYSGLWPSNPLVNMYPSQFYKGIRYKQHFIERNLSKDDKLKNKMSYSYGRRKLRYKFFVSTRGNIFGSNQGSRLRTSLKNYKIKPESEVITKPKSSSPSDRNKPKIDLSIDKRSKQNSSPGPKISKEQQRKILKNVLYAIASYDEADLGIDFDAAVDPDGGEEGEIAREEFSRLLDQMITTIEDETIAYPSNSDSKVVEEKIEDVESDINSDIDLVEDNSSENSVDDAINSIDNTTKVGDNHDDVDSNHFIVDKTNNNKKRKKYFFRVRDFVFRLKNSFSQTAILSRLKKKLNKPKKKKKKKRKIYTRFFAWAYEKRHKPKRYHALERTASRRVSRKRLGPRKIFQKKKKKLEGKRISRLSWRNWSNRSLYDIIRQRFYIRFRHGLGEYRMYKRRLVNYFTGRVYNPDESMFKEFPHYKRRFMAQDWAKSFNSFRHLRFLSLSDTDKIMNDLTASLEYKFNFLLNSLDDDSEDKENVISSTNFEPVDNENLLNLFRLNVRALGRINTYRAKGLKPEIRSYRMLGETKDLPYDQPPPLPNEYVWKERIYRPYFVLNRDFVKRLANTKVYLDKYSGHRAKSLFFHWRTMNKRHYDYTRKTHEWWPNSSSFKWPFARFISDFVIPTELQTWKRLGLTSRYRRFYLNYEGLRMRLRDDLDRDVSKSNKVTRFIAYQFLKPASYMEGEDVIEVRRNTVSFRESFGLFFKNFPWFRKSNLSGVNLIAKDQNLVKDSNHVINEDSIDSSESLNIDFKPKIDYTFLAEFLQNVFKLGEDAYDGDNLDFETLLKRDDIVSNYSKKICDEFEFLDYDDSYNNDDNQLDIDSNFLESFDENNFLDYFYNPNIRIFDYDFFSEMDFSSNLISNSFKINDYPFYSESDTFSGLNNNFYLKPSSPIPIPPRFRRPDLFLFNEIQPLPYYNRISSYLDSSMSNFVFDSYELDKLPIVYLNHMLYTRYHRHKLLPPEIVLNGETINKKYSGKYPLPSLFAFRGSFAGFLKGFIPYSENKYNRFAVDKGNKPSYYELFKPGNFIHPHWSWWPIPYLEKNDYYDSEFEHLYLSLNNQLLRPYDIIGSRVPDLKFGETSASNILPLFYNDNLFRGNPFLLFENKNLLFKSLDPVVVGSELPDIYKWNWRLIRDKHQAFSFLDLLRSTGSDAYGLPTPPVENNFNITFADLKRRGIGWRPRYFYIVPNNFRSLVAFVNDHTKLFYPYVFENLDSTYKLDDFKQKQILSRNPSLSSLFIYKFLSYSDHFSYFDPIHNNFINIFQEDDSNNNVYSDFSYTLEEYLDMMESLNNLGFDDMLMDSPQNYLGKYSQSSSEIDPMVYFINRIYRFPRRLQKRNAFEKNKRRLLEPRKNRIEYFIHNFKIDTDALDAIAALDKDGLDLKRSFRKDITHLSSLDPTVNVRRYFKRLGTKTFEEVLVLNSFYAFINTIRKIFRFILLDFSNYLINPSFFFLSFKKFIFLIKIWFGKWLSLFSFFVVLGFLIVWVWYRSESTLIVKKYEIFSPYILDLRPNRYFNSFKTRLEKLRLYIVFKSFGNLSPSKYLPFVGSKINNDFLKFHEGRVKRFYNRIDSFVKRTSERGIFFTFLYEIKMEFDKGMLELRYKIREIQLLFNRKFIKKKK